MNFYLIAVQMPILFIIEDNYSQLIQYVILEKLVTCMLLVSGCPVFESQLHLKLCFESTGLIAPMGSWGMGINTCGHKFEGTTQRSETLNGPKCNTLHATRGLRPKLGWSLCLLGWKNLDMCSMMPDQL